MHRENNKQAACWYMSDITEARRDRRVVRGEATRAAIISAARVLFAERGYAAVGTTDVVKHAGATRGAMYHHFREKKDIFRAVFEQVQQESKAAITASMAAASNPWEAFVEGIRTFLDRCLDPGMAQISLVEAPAVLGWQEWHERTDRDSLGIIETGLRKGIKTGLVRGADAQLLARLLFGALAEAGLLLAHAQDPSATRVRVERALLLLLEGLRASRADALDAGLPA